MSEVKHKTVRIERRKLVTLVDEAIWGGFDSLILMEELAEYLGYSLSYKEILEYTSQYGDEKAAEEAHERLKNFRDKYIKGHIKAK